MKNRAVVDYMFSHVFMNLLIN